MTAILFMLAVTAPILAVGYAIRPILWRRPLHPNAKATVGALKRAERENRRMAKALYSLGYDANRIAGR